MYEKINYYNRINAHLADFYSVMTAYNNSGQIPGSTTRCQNKLTCLQSICELSKIPSCNSMQIWVSANWGKTSCNATIYDNLLLLKSDEWYGAMITTVVFSTVSMLLAIINGLFRRMYGKNIEIAMIIMTWFLNIASFVMVSSMLMSLIGNAYQQTDYLVIGAKYVEFYYCVVEVILLIFMHAIYFNALNSYKPQASVHEY